MISLIPEAGPLAADRIAEGICIAESMYRVPWSNPKDWGLLAEPSVLIPRSNPGERGCWRLAGEPSMQINELGCRL